MSVRMSAVLRVVVIGAIALGLCQPARGAQVPDPAPHAAAPVSPPVDAATPAIPSEIFLEPGELRSVLLPHPVSRVAVGNPEVVDVSIITPREVLLQAKKVGTTNFLVWDEGGKHGSAIEVVEQGLQHKLERLLAGIGLEAVQVKREQDKLFLVGEVGRQEDVLRVQQMASAFGERVTSLVGVVPPPLPPPPEAAKSVVLQVQLIEMSKSATDTLGVDWSSLQTTTFSETPFPAVGPDNTDFADRIDHAFRLGAYTRTAISPTLKALIENGKARILAEPKLVAATGKEAKATLGVEIPIVTATDVSNGVVTQSVEFKNTGVELTFTPTLLEVDRLVQLKIQAKVSSIDSSDFLTLIGGTQIPSFRIRETNTEFVSGLGDPVVISGLLQDEERKSMTKVPGMGNVPVLGNLFRSTEFIRGLTELVMVVTPDLLQKPEEASDRMFLLEQALATNEVAGSVNDPTLRYLLQVQERIAKVLRYPGREKELGLSGRVKLRLHIFKDGTLGKAAIADSSGIDALDTEALKAAESQSPYPAFPSNVAQHDLWLEVPVIFKP